jgi:uncharacterized membrane-anchored protein
MQLPGDHAVPRLTGEARNAKHYRAFTSRPEDWPVMTSSVVRSVTPAGTLRRAASKVPEVTVYFWIIKILTTGMGEAAADYLQGSLAPVIAIGFTGTLLLASLVVQYWMRQYVAWVYWSAVVMVSVFGTLVADGLRHALGLSHAQNTAVFVVALSIIFAAWYTVERTLSIHSIHTARRETFYWATVMATFALGTAVGDWTAETLGLGFLASGLMFGIAMAVPAIAHRWAGVNAILAFWTAYVLTRPLGASFADWLAVPPSHGGLGLGTLLTTIITSAMIFVLVAYLAISRSDAEHPEALA